MSDRAAVWQMPSDAADRVATAWQMLTEVFGPAFPAAYGDVAPTLWAEAITRLGDAELKRGFDAIVARDWDYPANLTQFVALCRPGLQSPRYLGRPLTETDRRRLLGAPKDRAAASKWIAKMRARLEPRSAPAREPGCDDEPSPTTEASR